SDQGAAIPGEAKDLQLFLAKQDGGAWMNLHAAEAVRLDDDGNLRGFEPMNPDLRLNSGKHFG
ncbi:hypothetical protein PHYSODRAFT_418523, partial [Phytophthora sojae]